MTDIKDLEKQILHYILKDVKYIKEIFQIKGMDRGYFSDKDIFKLTDVALNYFENYGVKLVRSEFEKTIDAQRDLKLITDSDHATYISIYNEAIDDLNEDEDEAFERIFDDWINAEAAKKINDAIAKHQGYLQNYRGIEFLEKIKNEFESINRAKRDLSGIEVADWILDIDSQYEWLQKIQNKTDPPIQTGIQKLDNLFIGFARQQLTLIVALAGVGKSTFMLNLARNILIKEKKNVLFISLEMPVEQIKLKLDSIDMGMSYFNYRKGNESQTELDNYREKAYKRKEDIAKEGKHLKIFRAPSGSLCWDEIVTEYRKRLPFFEPDIIFIDYLALINLGEDDDRRDVLLGDLTRDVRAYGQVTNIPIVMAAQAGRKSENRASNGTKKVEITVTTIEDSNKVGQHIDNGIALTFNIKPGEIARKIIATIFKHRDGPIGTVEMDMNSEYCWIGDMDNDENSLAAEGFDSDLTDELLQHHGLDLGIDDIIDSIDDVAVPEPVKASELLSNDPAPDESPVSLIEPSSEASYYDDEDDYHPRVNDEFTGV